MTIRLYLMRWCTTLIGVQLLCGIVWVLGPLVPPFEPWPVRLASVLVLLLVWVAWNFALDLAAHPSGTRARPGCRRGG